jgi:hypothetical protein
MIITAELCECGRLYKDRRDETGKFMCAACYTGLDVEDLKKLWGTPVPTIVFEMFTKKN